MPETRVRTNVMICLWDGAGLRVSLDSYSPAAATRAWGATKP